MSREKISNSIPKTMNAIDGTIKRDRLMCERKREAGIRAVPAKIDITGHTLENG